MRADLERLVQEYLESLNNNDLDRLGQLLDPALEYDGFGDDARATGAESYLATVRYLKGTDSEIHGTITDMIVDSEANRAVAIIDMRRPDDRFPTLQVTTIITVDQDGRIAKLAEKHSPIRPRQDPCNTWEMGRVPRA